MKSIIVEGPNGAGKSTLITQLSKILDMPSHHAGSDAGSETGAMNCCIEQIGWIREGAILDRITPISRVIYQKGLGLRETYWLGLMADIMCQEAHIIYCIGNGEFTEKEYYPEGHLLQITDEREHIRAKYREVMNALGHIKYDWKLHNIHTLIDTLRAEG
jgi:energy-coupling factor transporter ATP-binding protein EcfA2